LKICGRITEGQVLKLFTEYFENEILEMLLDKLQNSKLKSLEIIFYKKIVNITKT